MPKKSANKQKEEEEEEVERKDLSEEQDDDDDDNEDDDIEEEEGQETLLNATGSGKFSSALKKLLSQDPKEENESESSKLFQRKTKMMKLAEHEKIEQLEHKRIAKEKESFDNKSLVRLPETNPIRINHERDLKRIATRGVVALFNAIGTHQRASSSSSSNNNTNNNKSDATSKEAFLKLLQEKASGKLTTTAIETSGSNKAVKSKSSSWKVLQEDFMDNNESIDSQSESEDDLPTREHEGEEDDSE